MKSIAVQGAARCSATAVRCLCTALVATLSASPVAAQSEYVIGFQGTSPEPDPTEARWVVCFTLDQEADTVYVGSIIQTTYADAQQQPTDRWRSFLKKEVGLSERLVGGCNVEKTIESANWRYGEFIKQDPYFPHKLRELSWVMSPVAASAHNEKPQPEKAAQSRQMGATSADEEARAAAEPSKSSPQLVAEEAAKRRAEREAEFQAKQAEYERKVAEQQKMVEEYKKAQDDVARAKAEQQARADAAAVKFRAEQEAYAAQLREHEESEAAARKLLADWDKRYGLGGKKASTDEDANRCITAPETQLNAAFKGNTAASVVNGCGQPVDVRICLMTSTKGWNCGVIWGLQSQQKWSYSSFNATGQVFVDARTTGSSKALAQPQ